MCGEKYWQCSGHSTNPGGGGNNGDNPNAILPNKKILYTPSQYATTGGYVKSSCDCMCVTQKIMKQILGNNTNIGSNATKIQLYLENGSGQLYKVGDANTVSNVLNTHLDNHHPIIVGVNHSPNRGINEGATDHFVVINGRGFDEDRGQYFYNYIETAKGASNGISAMSDSNRLYYDKELGTFKTDDGAANGKRTYTITQIRPNN